MAEERVQRRLGAILAADVVGYSRLMEADETGTLDDEALRMRLTWANASGNACEYRRYFDPGTISRCIARALSIVALGRSRVS